MDLTVTASPATTLSADVLLVGLPANTTALPRELKDVDALVDGWVARDLKEKALRGKLGDVAWYRPAADSGYKRVGVLGLGETADVDATAVRRAAYVGVQAAAGFEHHTVVFQLYHRGRRLSVAGAAEAVAEGAVLATFNPRNWTSNNAQKPAEITEVTIADVPSRDAARARKAADRGVILGEAANFTKFLQNEPANAMTPTDMAKHAKALGKQYGLDVKVLTRAQCEKLGMGSYLSVSSGSAQPPQFLVVRYEGRRKSTRLALVGKGVTFDTGGISLKPALSMEEMKYDMSGAATVLGAMRAIAQLKPAVSVVGICPCTENMPGGRATKPGDIVKAMNGKTIEVINTDAEGRLILADALAYAVEKEKATQIVDLATLTGACIIALGHEYAAAMTNDEQWCKQVCAAAGAAGEKVWQLPMDARFGEQVESKICDIKNIGNAREAGTIIGGKFLEHFVGDTPWTHLDIAGVAWVDAPAPGMAKGATAAMMRTLVTLAMSL